MTDSPDSMDNSQETRPLSAAPSEQTIYRQLWQAIESGELKPGDRLPPERELAEHFGTTRNLVRRAVKRLEDERQVSRYVGRGTFVTERENSAGTGKDLNTIPNVSPLDVLEARVAIEPGFADLVVARATEDDFNRLEELIVEQESASTQQEFREAGYAFHLEIARVTRNPLLVRIFEIIIEAREVAGWGRLKSLNSTPGARKSQAAANRAILESLRERDGDKARRLLRGHLGTMAAVVTFRPDE